MLPGFALCAALRGDDAAGVAHPYERCAQRATGLLLRPRQRRRRGSSLGRDRCRLLPTQRADTAVVRTGQRLTAGPNPRQPGWCRHWRGGASTDLPTRYRRRRLRGTRLSFSAPPAATGGRLSAARIFRRLVMMVFHALRIWGKRERQLLAPGVFRRSRRSARHELAQSRGRPAFQSRPSSARLFCAPGGERRRTLRQTSTASAPAGVAAQTAAR